eukprot:jgi/Botrbrau1/14466/Bobra.0014s0104.1
MSIVSAHGLCLVRPRASCVIKAPLQDAWTAVRDWAPFAWLSQVDGRPVVIRVVEGEANTAVGSTREVTIGDSRIYERLVAIDDQEHILRWQLISHPNTVNPFVASIINYVTTIRMERITVGDQTFFDWQGEFFTEPNNVEVMRQTLERWYVTGMTSLQAYLSSLKPKVSRPVLPASRGISPFPLSRSDSPKDHLWAGASGPQSGNLLGLPLRTLSGPSPLELNNRSSPTSSAPSPAAGSGPPLHPVMHLNGPQTPNQVGRPAGDGSKGSSGRAQADSLRQSAHPVGLITSLADLGRISLSPK